MSRSSYPVFGYPITNVCPSLPLNIEGERANALGNTRGDPFLFNSCQLQRLFYKIILTYF
jgi:hypothetical protein